jgi:hypothetical protein
LLGPLRRDVLQSLTAPSWASSPPPRSGSAT